MSWKGFKKAMNRLPHLIQSKAGYTEDTVDEEFVHLQSQFQELEALTGKLNDSASKYKTAIISMFKHQESFAKTLLEVYEPISGKQFGSGEGLNAPKTDKKNRPKTADESMRCAQSFVEATARVSDQLIPEIEVMVERRVVQPTQDWIGLHKHVEKVIAKRDRKRIDYDRARENLKRAQQAGTQQHETKNVKLQSSVEEAYAEYEKINGVLKEQLPQYIYLRVPFLDPILESLILFQDHLFVSMVQSYYPMESYVDRSLSVVEGYERKKDIVVPLLQEISILSKAPITSPNMGEAQLDGEVSEFDDDVNNSRQSVQSQSSQPPLYPPLTKSTSQIDQPPAPPSMTNRFQSAVGGAAIQGAAVSAGIPPATAKRMASNDQFNARVGNQVIQQAKSQATGSTSLPPPSTGPKPFSYGQQQQPAAPSKPNFLISPTGGQFFQQPSTTAIPPPYQAPPPVMPRPVSGPTVQYARVLYDFDAQQPGDLSIHVGDRVEVLERTDDVNGWWQGRVRGQTGVFPGNYVHLE